MKTNRLSLLWMAAATLAIASPASAQKADEKPAVMIGPIIAIDAIIKKATAKGQKRDLDQVIETLDPLYKQQLVQTDRYRVVANRKALEALVNVQDFHASGNVDGKTAARMFELTGAKYLATGVVTEFNYGKQKINFKGVGAAVERTVLRMQVIINVYDTTTGEIMARGSQKRTFTEISAKAGNLGNPFEGEVLNQIANKMAEALVNDIVDIITPAKIDAKLGKTVIIDRGKQSGISLGEVLDVAAPFARPGRKTRYISVGQVKVTRVDADEITAIIHGEDNGIDEGCIVRRVQKAPEETTKPDGGSTKAPEKPKSLRDRLKEKQK
jgi:curli biogenesis system outer membrane secretion channel CsgG